MRKKYVYCPFDTDFLYYDTVILYRRNTGFFYKLCGIRYFIIRVLFFNKIYLIILTCKMYLNKIQSN